MKKFLNDFKEFAFKGNILDLAVGMMIGSAFTAIVTSLVNDIFMPIFGLLTGKVDFSKLFLSLDGKEYATLADAEAAGAAVLKYGRFISAFINFLLIAIVIFLFLKIVVKLKKPKEEAAPTTKKCPFCKSDVHIEALRCPYCTSVLEGSEESE